MPSGQTPILGLTIPTVGGDANTWGGELNANINIIDSLGAGAVQNASSNLSVVPGKAPESFVRITTGGMTVTATMPDPASLPIGKLFTLKVLDIGSVLVQCSNPGVTFDGQLSYLMANQYNFVRLLSNGANYDIVG